MSEKIAYPAAAVKIDPEQRKLESETHRNLVSPQIEGWGHRGESVDEER
jgi:hypothetical protein